MKKSRFTEEQIMHALKSAEGGEAVSDICRKMGVSQNSFYGWRRKYQGMAGVTELRKLRTLEDENRKLKRLVADLSLDRHMLQELIAKKL